MSYQGSLTMGAFKGVSLFTNVYKQGVSGSINVANQTVNMSNVNIQFDPASATWTFSGTASIPVTGNITNITFGVTPPTGSGTFAILIIDNLNIPVNQGDVVNVSIKATVTEPATITLTVQ